MDRFELVRHSYNQRLLCLIDNQELRITCMTIDEAFELASIIENGAMRANSARADQDVAR
ncbi:hypothetical protein GCM10012275_28520 [Longimycelium tulufanense]|uniref:Uncharacterized protein n=1 Tax=Longimycelium tulufanense TaxID=907463 RepID=A0A8J3C8P9_9PSEU|nr:hypothetical protein GCM10012275_28520 [Longimycelium tulufanense]